MVDLRYYQHEAAHRVLTDFDLSQHREVVSIPTGGGKTLLAASLLSTVLSWDKDAWALVSVPFLDLVTQTEGAFTSSYFSKKDVGIVQGPYNQVNRRAIIASVDTLLVPGRLDALLAAHKGQKPSIIISDECHHGTLTPKYLAILDRLLGPETLFTGFSATPFRSDNRSLRQLWTDGMAYSISPLELILGGYLSDVRCYDVETDLDLTGFEVDGEEGEDGHTLPSPLRRQLEKSNRFARCYEAWMYFTGGVQRTLFFKQDVRDCYAWKEYLEQRGIECPIVEARTSKTTRDSIYERFAQGELKAVVNYRTMATGLDIPSIECIVIDQVMGIGAFRQATGRGMRLFEGKKYLTLLNMTDKHHTLSASRELTGKLTPEVPSVRQALLERITHEQQEEFLPAQEIRPLIEQVRTRTYNVFTGDGWHHDPTTDTYVKQANGLGTIVVEGDLTGYRVSHLSSAGKRTWLAGTREQPTDALQARVLGQEHLEWVRGEKSKQQGHSPELNTPLKEWQWKLLKRRLVPKMGETLKEAQEAGMLQSNYYDLDKLLKEHGSAHAANKATGWQCVGRVPKPPKQANAGFTPVTK